MHPPSPPVPGIVFRRLQSAGERRAAESMLADGGAPAPTVRGQSGGVLFGLWDLAASDSQALVATAATRPLDAGGSVELCGIVVCASLRRRGLGRRLVNEVADVLRSEGAERLVARPECGQCPAGPLLAQAGFTAVTDGGDAPPGVTLGWRYLEL
jgi:GNAT superfamily N-acetyltransferase